MDTKVNGRKFDEEQEIYIVSKYPLTKHLITKRKRVILEWRGCDRRTKRSAAERSHPTSEVRGRSREDSVPKGGGQEELPHVQGQGQQPRVPGCDGAGTAERSYPASEVRGGGQEEPTRPGRSHPAPEARSGGQEEQPHLQGAVAVRACAGGPNGAIPR